MHQEDELDFDEDELVLQPSAASITSTAQQPRPSDVAAAQPVVTQSATAPSATQQASAAHDPSLDATGKKLPHGWVSRISNTTGELYYRDTISNTSSWDIPTTSAVVPAEDHASASDPVQDTAQSQPASAPAPDVPDQAVAATSAPESVEKPLPTGPKSQARAAPAACESRFLFHSLTSQSAPVLTNFAVTASTGNVPTGPRAASSAMSEAAAAYKKRSDRVARDNQSASTEPKNGKSPRDQDTAFLPSNWGARPSIRAGRICTSILQMTVRKLTSKHLGL